MCRSSAIPSSAFLYLVLANCICASEIDVEFIRLDDLVLDSPLQIQWCWNATGIDAQDRVYAVFGGPSGDSVDCAVFQYDSRTGDKRFLGTATETLKAADNWVENEPVEKGHTHLPYLNGKIYIGTQGFHFASGANSKGMRDALNSRGAHILAYDTATDRMLDVSRDQPDGVFFKGRGFIALSDMPSHNLLIGLTVPHGDLLLYDDIRKKVRATVPGVKEALGVTRIGRELVAADNGKIYWMYGPLDPSDGPGQMYVYDLAAGKRNTDPIAIDPWCWNGQAKTIDGSRIYLSNRSGRLYRLDTETDGLVSLGEIVPAAEREKKNDERFSYGPPLVQGIYLSADATRIYAIASREMQPVPPSMKENGKPVRFREPIGLFEYNIASGQVEEVHRFPRWNTFCYVTGSNIRDSQGNLYFAVHAGRKGLLKINVSNRNK